MKQQFMKVLVLCLLLIFVAGCGSDKEDNGEIQVHDLPDELEEHIDELEEAEEALEEYMNEDNDEPETTDEEPAEEIETTGELKIGTDEQETLEGRLNRNTKAIASRSFTPQLAVGESMVLGFGITNTRSVPYDFDIKPEFRRATYGSGTGIQFVEEETVLEWIDGVGESYYIDDQEQVIFPFKVTIGDTINSDGDPVEEGNYVFEFVVTYQEGNFNTAHEIVEFTVKTKIE
jgi:hypothetical protein